VVTFETYTDTPDALCCQEAQLARGEAEKIASLAEAESQCCLALEREMMMKMEEEEEKCEGGSLGSRLQQGALAEKDRLAGGQVLIEV
jgi:hypothetical protein